MDKKVNAYIKSIVNKSNLNGQQRNDLEEYLKCTFEEHYNNYISQNISSELALNKALDKLGTPSEFLLDLEGISTNKVNKTIQFTSIVIITINLLAIILANINNSSVVNQLPDTFYESFLTFFNINIRYNIPQIIMKEEIARVFIIAMFFIPIGFFLPLVINKINVKRYMIYAYILLVSIIEFLKIFMISNPRLIWIIFNFLACFIGYVILKVFILIFSTTKSLKNKDITKLKAVE